MYLLNKFLKTGGLALLAAGILLAAACKSPVYDSDNAPDKNSLIAKISEAEALLASLTESADGADVDTNKYWVVSTWELSCAIDDARKVADSRAATAKDVKVALDALTEAYNKANNAKKPGTKSGNVDPGVDPGEEPGPGEPPPPPVDKSALNTKITEADALAASLQTSIDGDDIAPNAAWVSAAVKAQLAEAIAAAKDVANDEAAAAEAVEAALTDLAAAYEAAKSAQQKGTTPDKAALISKIAEAAGKMRNVKKSDTGGSQYRVDEWWVTTAAWDALAAALSAAEQSRDNSNATKASVDAALANLTAALSGFVPQPGISMADKDELNNLINEIEEKLNGVQTSGDGADVYDTDQWVSAAEKEALETALSEARAVADNPAAPQEEVDALAPTLQDALDAFNPQPGTKAVGLLEFVSVEFIGPQDELITLTGAQALSWVSNDTLRITVVEETFATRQWYVDGAIKAGETGASLTLQARSFARGSTHTVTLKVTTASGVPYTKTLTFAVN